MKFQIPDHTRVYITQLLVDRQTKAKRSVRSRGVGYRSMKPNFPRSPWSIASLLGLIITVILTSCNLPAGNSPIASQDEYGILIPSPTPTFVLPGPDDEDPIMDCVLDAPGCIIGTGIESIDGAVYIGASIAIDRGQLEDFTGTDEELVLDAKIAVSNKGVHAGDIEVRDHTIAAASPDDGLVLISPDGDPLVNVITSVDGFLFYCNRNLFPRCPQQSPLFSFDPETGDIIIHSREGIPVGEVEFTFPSIPPGVVFGDGSDDTWPNWLWGVYGNDTDDAWPPWGDDAWPNWGWGFSSDDTDDTDIVISDQDGYPVVTLVSSEGVLFVFEPNGSPIATIGPDKNNSHQPVLNFIDSDGDPITSLSPREGKVFINKGLGGAPVSIVTPNNKGVEKVEQGESIILTTYIPVTGWDLKEADLTGTMEVYTKDAAGIRNVVSRVSVEIEIEDISIYIKVEEGESVKKPTATPVKAPPKSTPVPTKPKDKTKPTPTPSKK